MPDNIDKYYDGGAEAIEIVEKCFGDGHLPQRYLDQLNFANEIGDCPTYNVDIIFGAAPNTLGALVSSMNSFSEAEISDQSNSVYKQRMVDIMKIKQLGAIVDQNEVRLKDTMRISLNNAMNICDDVDPLFNLIKTEVYLQKVQCFSNGTTCTTFWPARLAVPAGGAVASSCLQHQHPSAHGSTWAMWGKIPLSPTTTCTRRSTT